MSQDQYDDWEAAGEAAEAENCCCLASILIIAVAFIVFVSACLELLDKIPIR